MTRAQNIEQAKFQLEGLGVAWEDIQEDINYGVQDTAYGLDAAAKAASQLVASQVSLGDDMKTALRGISGVAAMTSSSYEEISQIFTRVAGNGRVYAEDLQSFSSRGLNAAATLATYLNKTEKEVRQMVSDGEIDFKTFASAMDSAFGEHAKDANKTFSGAMSNVRAALSRVGAEFASPYLDNMRQIFTALIPLINTFKSAMAPIVTVYASAFNSLTERLILFLDTLNNADAMESGMESIGNILDDIYKSFMPVLGTLPTIAISIKKVISSIVAPIREAFNEIFPNLPTIQQLGTSAVNAAMAFSKFTSSLRLNGEQQDYLKRAFKGLFTVVKMVLGVLRDGLGIFSAITPYVASFVNILLKAAARLGDFIVNTTSVQEGLEKIKNKLVAIIQVIRDKLLSYVEPIKQVFATIVQSVKDFLSNFDATKAGVIGGSVLIAKAIDKLAIPIAKLKEFFMGGGMQDAAKGAGPFKEICNQLSSAIGQLTNAINATTLIEIAIAIALLAAALVAISSIDSGRLAQSIAVIGSLFIALGAAFNYINSVSLVNAKGVWELRSIGAQLTSLAVSILILAVALKVLATIDYEDSIKSLFTLFSVLGQLAIFLRVAKFEELSKLGKQLKSLAVSIVILAAALKILGSMSLNELGKGLIGLGGILLELGIFSRLVKPNELRKVASSLLPLSVALVIISAALKIMATMSWEDMAKSLITTAVAMGIMVGALKLLPKDSALGAAGMLIMASALIVIALALNMLKGMSWEEAGVALSVLAIGLFSLVAACAIMKEAVPGAAAMLIVAAALAILVPQLIILSKMSFVQIITMTIAMAAAFTILGVAGVALSKVTGPLMKVAGVIVLIGAGMALAGAGVFLFAAGLTALTAAGTAGVAALAGVLVSLLAIVPVLALLAVEFIASFIAGIAAKIGDISISVKSIVETLIQTAIDVVTSKQRVILECVYGLIEALLQTLSEHIQPIVEAGGEVIVNFVNGMATELPRIIDAGINFIVSFINGVAEGISEHGQEFQDAIWNLINAVFEQIGYFLATMPGKALDAAKSILDGFMEGFDIDPDTFWNSVKDAFNSLVEKVKKIKDDFLEAGKSAIQGFIDGLTSMPGKLINAATSIASSAINTAKDTLDINSPSKVFRKIGRGVPEGFIQGITAMNNQVEKATDSMASSSISAMSDSISLLSDALTTDLDSEPVITPVVDLSNVTAANGVISSVFGQPGLTFGTNLNTSFLNSRRNDSNTDTGSKVINYYFDGINVNGTTDGSMAEEIVDILTKYQRLAAI
jgi:tape measure domain-containing protein